MHIVHRPILPNDLVMGCRRVLTLTALIVLAACGEDATDAGKPRPPAAPRNLTALPAQFTFNAITLAWPPVAGATSYNLYWRTTPDVSTLNGTRIAGVDSGYVHTGLSDNTAYYYVLTAINDVGESAASAIAHSTASGVVLPSIVIPDTAAVVDTSLFIVVRVASEFQIATVVARVSSRFTNLAFDPDYFFPPGHGGRGPAWLGRLSLSGLPHGTTTLTVSATDVLSNVGVTSVDVREDMPPTLIVTSPNDSSLARPTVHIAITCQDDTQAGCTYLRVYADDSQTPVASGQASVDQVVSLAAYDGRGTVLHIDGADSAGQVIHADRKVFVELSSQLSEVASVNGTIWDFQPDRLLYLDKSSGGKTVTIRDRATGNQTVVFGQAGTTPLYGFLTPDGALFVVDTGQSTLTNVLYDWNHGALTDLGKLNAYYSLRVSGQFAIWSAIDFVGANPRLIRRDLATRVNIEVDHEQGTYDNDVASNGDVVYWKRFGNSDIWRFRGGVSTQLTSNTGVDNTQPVTDGENVVFLRGFCCGYQVILIDMSGGEHNLAEPGGGYRAAGGWVAYTKPDAFGQQQVWSRSSMGEERQITQFASSSTVDAVGPNGEVVLSNNLAGVSKRYLAVPPYAPPLRQIGSGQGSAIFQNGELFILLGGSLLRVTP